MPRFALFVGAIVLTLPALAQPPEAPKPKESPRVQAWFVDDEKYFDDFMEKLTVLATGGKCLATEKLTARMKRERKAKVAIQKPDGKVYSPEESYRRALPSVFTIGSVYKDKDGEWADGLYATAWVAGADGILVTNWHVFEDLEEGEVFGAADHQGNVYPLVEFLGGDKIADVAVVRIDAKGLTPLPIADAHAEVGSWVAVLGHPGDNFFVYTQGHVTRYSTNKNDDGQRERWMGLTAEYAGGSSGSPVLNRNGAVVGMAALTLTIGEELVMTKLERRKLLMGKRTRNSQPPVAPPPREKGSDKPIPAPSVQMILKMAVPSPTILRSFAK